MPRGWFDGLFDEAPRGWWKKPAADASLLLAILALMALWLSAAGCVLPPELEQVQAPSPARYESPEAHAGRDIEAEQGLVRKPDGWIVSGDRRYRVIARAGKPVCEWRVSLPNMTDQPRWGFARATASVENYAPGAKICLEATGEARDILPPGVATEIGGEIALPNATLRGFSVYTEKPLPAPQARGPVALGRARMQDGRCVLPWTATTAASRHSLTTTWCDERGRRIGKAVKDIAPGAYRVTCILYARDGSEIGRQVVEAARDRDDMVRAKGEIIVTPKQAADVGSYSAAFTPIEDPADQPQGARTIRARVTAYCPCARCCGRMTGRTATGATAWRPGVASDWTALPAGSRVRIEGYGVAEVDDTGGACRRAWRERGEILLDVRTTYHWQARQWGSQWLDVEVLRG